MVGPYCNKLQQSGSATVDNKPALSNGGAWALLTVGEGPLVLLCQADEGKADQATDGNCRERSEGDSVHGVTGWVCTL